MIALVCLVGLLPLAGLLLLLLVPTRLADARPHNASRWVCGIAAGNLAGALLLTAATSVHGPMVVAPAGMESAPVTLLLDTVSTVMGTLVAFVGWVTCRYAVRHLDGEPHQGRYMRWAGVTIAAVTLVVLSADLLLILLAFLLASLGLHQLLVHYSDRRAALGAAATRFAFSRLGDLCLFAAAILLYRDFQTWNLVELFRAVERVWLSGGVADTHLAVVPWLIAGCAVLKSAQFPFHIWLPETMEAPTPVSALMHAGVVNSGGYLLIRTAPLMEGSSLALPAVACLGAFTAVAGAVVMMTQTRVKQRLAYSTVAQMGFMMLQCGVGAYSAALLHILAHSLYKAHAFLASGTVATPATTQSSRPAAAVGPGRTFATATVVAGLFLGIGWMFGVSPLQKPGGILLGSLLCCGLTLWLLQSAQERNEFPRAGLLAAALLITCYQVGYVLCDLAVWSSRSHVESTPDVLTASLIAAGLFAALTAVEAGRRRLVQRRFMQSLYVHASHGFYVDAFWRRVANSLVS